MRLRNRLSKAGFWTDSDLLRWPRDKRFFYKGLWHLAEDSGCLENDPFTYKLLLFPSPLDSDITVTVLLHYCEEFVAAGKLVPYTADGKDYYFLRRFHRHQGVNNPGAPEVPLPEWITFTPSDNPRRGGVYKILPPYDEPAATVTAIGKGKPIETKRIQEKRREGVLSQHCHSAVTALSIPLLLRFSEQVAKITSIPLTYGIPEVLAAQEDNLLQFQCIADERDFDWEEDIHFRLNKETVVKKLKAADCPAVVVGETARWAAIDAKKKPKVAKIKKGFMSDDPQERAAQEADAAAWDAKRGKAPQAPPWGDTEVSHA